MVVEKSIGFSGLSLHMNDKIKELIMLFKYFDMERELIFFPKSRYLPFEDMTMYWHYVDYEG